ncbi:MAG: hypothetical protein COB59_01325 [Rhodospirillaceae bacterium]|nr:MAG: hypothetical protein COB59_01325 [Rhodospirillaceae bacterium]
MVYILGGIAVNCLWGLAFLAPYVLAETSPLMIVFGRYVVYGLLSLAIMVFAHKSLTNAHWRMAFVLAFTGNVGYFLLMALAVQFAGIVIAALIVGTLPVVMALWGNWHERTVPYRRLIVPLALIFGGLATLNGHSLAAAETPKALTDILWGIGFAVGALALWSHYGVKNALYLKMHTDIEALGWANAIGVASLVQVVIGLLAYGLMFGFDLIPNTSEGLWDLIWVSLGLGVVVSWVATHVWNLASRHVSIVLVGQLIVFETLSSILYGHLADQTWPGLITVASALTVVFAVVLSLNIIGKNKKT